MELPRDIQLKILQKLDIDGRVRLAIIGRLKVPKAIADAIAAGLQSRIPIPAFILEMDKEKQKIYLDQRVSVRIPISNSCTYERYYDGRWLFHSQQIRSRKWIKFTAVIYEDELLTRFGFPDVDGLPADFVAANPQWVVEYPDDEWRLLCQPGSAYRKPVPT